MYVHICGLSLLVFGHYRDTSPISQTRIYLLDTLLTGSPKYCFHLGHVKPPPDNIRMYVARREGYLAMRHLYNRDTFTTNPRRLWSYLERIGAVTRLPPP